MDILVWEGGDVMWLVVEGSSETVFRALQKLLHKSQYDARAKYQVLPEIETTIKEDREEERKSEDTNRKVWLEDHHRLTEKICSKIVIKLLKHYKIIEV